MTPEQTSKVRELAKRPLSGILSPLESLVPTLEHLKDFERGEAAHKRGASLSDNPFPHHDRRHWDWELGWISADNPVPQ